MQAGHHRALWNFENLRELLVCQIAEVSEPQRLPLHRRQLLHRRCQRQPVEHALIGGRRQIEIVTADSRRSTTPYSQFVEAVVAQYRKPPGLEWSLPVELSSPVPCLKRRLLNGVLSILAVAQKRDGVGRTSPQKRSQGSFKGISFHASGQLL